MVEARRLVRCPAGAQCHEQRQQMLWCGMRDAGIPGLTWKGTEIGEVPALNGVSQPSIKSERPRWRRSAFGGKHPQIVNRRSRSDDQHTLFAQRSKCESDFAMIVRTAAAQQRKLSNRDVRLGIG